MKIWQCDNVMVEYTNYFISGPSASIVTNSWCNIEPLIKALCYATGDDNEDYTATELRSNEV